MFLATLAMAVLSAADLIDNVIAAREGESDAISAGSGRLPIVACFMFLLYGAPMHTATSPPHQLAIARHVLWLALALSLAGEIVITRATLHRRG
jgi:hypothetical protein